MLTTQAPLTWILSTASAMDLGPCSPATTDSKEAIVKCTKYRHVNLAFFAALYPH